VPELALAGAQTRAPLFAPEGLHPGLHDRAGSLRLKGEFDKRDAKVIACRSIRSARTSAG